MRAIACVLMSLFLVGCAVAVQQPAPFPPIHVGQSLEEIRAAYPDAKLKGALILGDLSGSMVTVAWPIRDGTVGAFSSLVRGVAGSQQARLDLLVERFCQGQETHPGRHAFEIVCGGNCPKPECVFLVDVDCFIPGKVENDGLAEDKSAYPDAVCTWVEAAKEWDAVAMANGYRMFNQPGGWGYQSR